MVNFSGGNAGGFNAFSGSEVNISGGSLGGFNAFSGSDVELIGGEFAVNGAAFMGPLITLGDGDVFTGTLQDGSAFVFSPLRLDSLSGVTLTAAALPALNNTPQVVSTDISAGTSGLRAGQSLTLQDGGVLGGNFSAIGATLNIEGGVVDGLETVGSEVNISGGTVDGFNAFNGSEVNISGGTVSDIFDAESGSTVNISGGTVGFGFFFANSGSEVNISGGTVSGKLGAFSGSVVNISGGTVSGRLDAESGSEVNISGGTVDDVFDAESGSMVNLMGTEFLLDGVLLDSLVAGEAFTINDRDVTLSGLLADGTPFEFDLNSTTNFFEDSFAPDATLTVTLSGALLGDVNKDGVVDFLDISPFISLLSTGEFQDEADIDSSGTVDFLDISPFIVLLSS